MSEYTTKDYMHMGRLRESALTQIARKLGKEHAITKMMGTAAWGRHPFETGPEQRLRNAVEYKAGLDGMFHILNLWARDNDRGAQRIMLDIYPTNYSQAAK